MGDHLAQLLTVDIQVSDQTDNRRGVNQYPLRLHKLAERRGLLFADANEQHVGIVTGDVGADSAQLRRHPRGVVMILLQALHVIFQRLQPGGGQDARLAHPAADHFPPADGAANVRLAAEQQRAYRSAKPL